MRHSVDHTAAPSGETGGRGGEPRRGTDGAGHARTPGARCLSCSARSSSSPLPLMLWWDRGTWFQLDDWDFLAARTGGNLGDLFRAHYEHWMTLPIVAYRLMWQLVGLHSVAPYQLLVIVGHLTVAALLRVVMRRAGVGPWLATAAATLFVFFGAGAENILVAFQITFVFALAFGLAHLLLADHDGPVDRRDWFGLLAGLAGLMCSGVAVSMVIVVGYATLLRRGWRIALLHTAPLGGRLPAVAVRRTEGGLARLLPRQLAGRDDPLRRGRVPRGVPRHRSGAGRRCRCSACSSSSGSRCAYARTGRMLRGQRGGPVALLGGAVTFLAITALYRSGTENGLAVLYKGFGPEHARHFALRPHRRRDGPAGPRARGRHDSSGTGAARRSPSSRSSSSACPATSTSSRATPTSTAPRSCERADRTS